MSEEPFLKYKKRDGAINTKSACEHIDVCSHAKKKIRATHTHTPARVKQSTPFSTLERRRIHQEKRKRKMTEQLNRRKRLARRKSATPLREEEENNEFLTKMRSIAQQPQHAAAIGDALEQMLVLARTQGESAQWDGASREQIQKIFKDGCIQLMERRMPMSPTVRIT